MKMIKEYDKIESNSLLEEVPTRRKRDYSELWEYIRSTENPEKTAKKMLVEITQMLLDEIYND